MSKCGKSWRSPLSYYENSLFHQKKIRYGHQRVDKLLKQRQSYWVKHMRISIHGCKGLVSGRPMPLKKKNMKNKHKNLKNISIHLEGGWSYKVLGTWDPWGEQTRDELTFCSHFYSVYFPVVGIQHPNKKLHVTIMRQKNTENLTELWDWGDKFSHFR